MSLVAPRGVAAEPVDQGQARLEALLFKATDPSNKIEDVNTIKLFCDHIEKITDGAIIAGRLLSHKIQSPQERESLQALAVVEAASKSSPAFVTEIGKFRFLNEMIKLISPKYLGTRSPDSVKQKVIELLYSWTKQFPREKKIVDAYTMLKGQGVIKSDPVYVGDAVFASALKPREADLSAEESRELQRLLQSRNPGELEKAKRIIQGMVKKDEAKMEKATRQAAQLQEVESNTRLLSDMLEAISLSETGEGDREIMSELYQTCETLRPKIFRLAAEADENDPVIGNILYASDELSRVMDSYKEIIILNKRDRPPAYSSVEGRLSTSVRAQSATAAATTSLGAADPLAAFLGNCTLQVETAPSLPDSERSEQSSMLGLTDGEADIPEQTSSSQPEVGRVRREENLMMQHTSSSTFTSDLLAEFGAVNDRLSSAVDRQENVVQDLLTDSPVPESIVTPDLPSSLLLNLIHKPVSLPSPTQVKRKGYAELDKLAESALIQNLPNNKEAAFVSRKQEKLSMQDMIRQRSETSEPPVGAFGTSLPEEPTNGADVFTPDSTSGVQNLNSLVTPTCEASKDLKLAEKEKPSEVIHQSEDKALPTKQLLNTISLSMDEVCPHPSLPVVPLLQGGGVTAVLHPTENRPQPGVSVFVLQICNTSKQKVEEIDFKAAVPKGMKVRLLPASATELPSSAPFTASPTLNQLMLVGNPSNLEILLSFVLSYTVDEETTTEIGKDVRIRNL